MSSLFESKSVYEVEAQRAWEDARRKALWTQLKGFIQGQSVQLLDFEEVSEKLHLRNSRYRGLKEIPLDKIVGSVGRYRDFLGAFIPTTSKMEDRWERIAAMFLDPSVGSVPPIEVYQVGDLYFVRDGNHRVSVATQLKLPTIEAYVWEYPLPIDPETVDMSNLDEMLVAAEKQDFMERTHLDETRPNHGLEACLPGAYRELLHEIMDYQERLIKIDADDPYAEPMTLENAAAAWYDMIYSPSVQIIKRDHILEYFPDRSPTDLFIWVRREQEKLESTYGHNIRLTQAIQAVNAQQPPMKKVMNTLKQWVRGDKVSMEG